jgi:glycosyltransferase involved in cell wall biosynthesis
MCDTFSHLPYIIDKHALRQRLCRNELIARITDMETNGIDHIYIIIPVYNEAEVIADVIKELSGHFSKIVCVNDGSSDSSEVAIEGTNKAILVNLPINLGQGAALQTGIEYALQDPKAQYFITFDADGQHTVKDTLTMLEVLKKENLDIVLGSRFLGHAEGINTSKRLMLKAAIAFSNVTTGLKLTDAHNGLRVFTRKFAENLHISMPDMSHASEIIQRIAEGDFKYKEVPVTIKYTDYSKTKGQSILNSVNISFDLLIHRLTKK